MLFEIDFHLIRKKLKNGPMILIGMKTIKDLITFKLDIKNNTLTINSTKILIMVIFSGI